MRVLLDWRLWAKLSRKSQFLDFPGGPVANHLLDHHLPMQWMQVQSLVKEVISHVPRGQKTKIQNRSTIVTNSIKTFKKMAYIKKS